MSINYTLAKKIKLAKVCLLDSSSQEIELGFLIDHKLNI